MTTVHLVAPEGLGDPARPSGGNSYDRHVCAGLAGLGWQVRVHEVGGAWPAAGAAARARLAGVFADLPAGALVLVDGLIGSAAPDVLVPEAGRLRLVLVVHMPFGETPPGHGLDDATAVRRDEQAALAAAAAVVVTSRWTRSRLIDRYGVPPQRVHVVTPGADPAEPARGTPGGGALLCVAAVAPHKGHDVLLAALAGVAELSWRCSFVGSLERDPGFVAGLRRAASAYRIDDRICFTGPCVGAELDRRYAAADALVLASRAESYGMVVTEALARGLPVLATEAGGVPEALGHAADGRRPGLLVPVDDDRALAGALRRWLQDDALRQRLREAAAERRETLPTWSQAADALARVLTGVAA